MTRISTNQTALHVCCVLRLRVKPRVTGTMLCVMGWVKVVICNLSTLSYFLLLIISCPRSALSDIDTAPNHVILTTACPVFAGD